MTVRHIGLGLYGMQSPWVDPAHPGRRVRQLLDHAVMAEDLGFDGLWLSEHRLWYDGYLSAPLSAAAAIAAATETIRIGTAVMLFPQHDPVWVATTAAQVDQWSNGRIDLGLGNGYRDIEFDALGVSRTERGARSSEGIDLMRFLWGEDDARPGHRFEWPEQPLTTRPLQRPVPIWVGAMSEPPIRRAASRRAGLILPGGWDANRLRAAIDLYRTEAAGPPRSAGFASVRFAWVADSDESARRYALPRLDAFLRDQYLGMAQLESDDPPIAPDASSQATIGSPTTVAADLLARLDGGIDTLIVRLSFPYADDAALRGTIELFAREVLPVLRGAGP